MRLVINNARLVDASGERGVHDLYLNDGVIEGIDLGGEVDDHFDAEQKLVTPALIDPHVHLREPGQEIKEDLASGLAAAAAGGFGTVVSMANTDPVVDEPELVAALIARAERLAGARLRPAAALTRGLRGETLCDYAALKAAGAVMVTDDGIPLADSHIMRRACEYAAEQGLVVQTHAEDPSLRQDGVMHEGYVSQQLGLPGNPASAEAVMIYRDCEVAELTGARVHIAHVSTKRGMQVIEWFKQRGAPVTCEVTPQHLTLSDACLETFDPIYKVAPPLRSDDDVAYLRDALARGVVDCTGTDHAPHTKAEKEMDMLEAPFGIANIEVAFPLLYTRLVHGGILPLGALLRLFQDGPAEVLGWQAPRLEPGWAADVVVIDLATPKQVEAARFKSKAKFSPWQGETLRGWPLATFVRGRQVYRAG